MTVATIKQNLFSPSEEMQMKYTLWMNHLLVIYALLLPISVQGRAQIQFSILILFVLRRNYYNYTKEFINNKIVISFILYFLLYIIWLIGTDDFHYARILISQNKYAIFFPLLILSFIDRRFVSKIISGFLAGIFISEISSYLVSLNIIEPNLHIFGKEIFHPYMTKYDPSPFMLHTKYGLALSLGVTLLIHNILTHKLNIFVKLISWLFVISATINISITGGRIAYILYIILIPLLIILVFKNKFIKPLLISILSIFIVYILAYNNSKIFKNRINYSINTISSIIKNPLNFNSSFGKRVGMWYYSKKTIEDNLLLGVGTGDHINAIIQDIKKEKSSFRPVVHPHNQFISILVQFGLIGLIIFLNLFYQIIRYKYISYYQKNIAILTTVAVAFTLMIEGDKVKFILPLWITIISISLATKKYINIKDTSINKKTMLFYFIILILALLLAFII